MVASRYRRPASLQTFAYALIRINCTKCLKAYKAYKSVLHYSSLLTYPSQMRKETTEDVDEIGQRRLMMKGQAHLVAKLPGMKSKAFQGSINATEKTVEAK